MLLKLPIYLIEMRNFIMAKFNLTLSLDTLVVIKVILDCSLEKFETELSFYQGDYYNDLQKATKEFNNEFKKAKDKFFQIKKYLQKDS